MEGLLSILTISLQLGSFYGKRFIIVRPNWSRGQKHDTLASRVAMWPSSLGDKQWNFWPESQVWHVVVAYASETQRPFLCAQTVMVDVLLYLGR